MTSDQPFDLNNAAIDPETGIRHVPFGYFTSFAPFARKSKQPASVRKLPVLQGDFDARKFDRRCLAQHFGYGAVVLGGMLMPAFRYQSGPDALYWLANPADVEVWRVMDRWAAAGQMVLSANFDGESVLLVRDFHLAPQMKAMRKAVEYAKTVTPQFVAAATAAILGDGLVKRVTTDLDQFPTLRNVQTCLVRTKFTGGIAVMEGRSDGNVSLADLARVLGVGPEMPPGATRH